MKEYEIRYIVNEIAKDIIPLEDILKTLNIPLEDFTHLSTSRPFKEALSSASIEWQGATNTPKRARLKAAAITEELMLRLFFLARDSNEGLGVKVKVLEAISKIAGLNTPDPVPVGVGTGNTFTQIINFGNGEQVALEIGGQDTPGVIEGEPVLEISSVFASDELEEL